MVTFKDFFFFLNCSRVGKAQDRRCLCSDRHLWSVPLSQELASPWGGGHSDPGTEPPRCPRLPPSALPACLAGCLCLWKPRLPPWKAGACPSLGRWVPNSRAHRNAAGCAPSPVPLPVGKARGSSGRLSEGSPPSLQERLRGRAGVLGGVPVPEPNDPRPPQLPS